MRASRRAAATLMVFCWMLLVSGVFAQNMYPAQANSQLSGPRPYAYGGLDLSKGSEWVLASSSRSWGWSGHRDESLLALTEFSADNDHKQDSGTGHDLYFQARVFYRISPGWYLGGGTQWNKLTTDRYSKEAWRPTFGGGKDVLRENFSMRAQVMYILPGTDRLNAVQGPEISLWLPSPVTRSHFFYRQTIGIYEFHQTSVPGNSGTNVRGASTFLNCTVMYRF